ncbi:hypothetical protein Lsed01_02270 [Demequina sediminis]|jgi:hypothetical protein|uniref:Uncharacterized protein n=1 Tax=Demequina sediminis TaxID=1930058 RepID=A0ABP9WKQ0_9MICO|nr:hypothetical protein [Demequina sediminis]BDZ60550.1 hypothetical protein GCM10025873_03410 [Demequina sediminis]
MFTEAVENTTHVVTELPIPAPAFGLLAFTGLMALLFVTFAFRSVGTRH